MGLYEHTQTCIHTQSLYAHRNRFPTTIRKSNKTESIEFEKENRVFSSWKLKSVYYLGLSGMEAKE